MKKDRASGKTRITIRLDDDVLGWFRGQVRSSGGSYQTAINLALRDYIAREPLEATMRRVLREELARAAGAPPESAYAYGPLPAALVADADDDGGDYGNAAPRPGRVARSLLSNPKEEPCDAGARSRPTATRSARATLGSRPNRAAKGRSGKSD